MNERFTGQAIFCFENAIAETFARDPKFYGATFCATCREHFAVCEFSWLDGTKVGS
jgi:hypothetical protein